ncbi:MAG: hypothetical protein Q9184_002471 [Pyrenodesmia sp. 2 TL-2023]
MSPPAGKPQVVAIVGATGTGKSLLAVTLAEKFNGEIINGDALQMYEGLPIATNKLPYSERKSIPHHLLGCINWSDKPWAVGKYVKAATGIIREIVARGKLPIIVGGTHYYVQSLLFESSLATADLEHQSVRLQEEKWPVLAASTEAMIDELRRIDPEEASRWHPNDRRKIRHSLEIFLTSGKTPSDVYRMQRAATTARKDSRSPGKEGCGRNEAQVNDAASPLRFDPLIFWTYADPDKLSTRLDRRVDAMVAAGLIEEVESMHRTLQEQERIETLVDQSSGIGSAIGFKEFLPYIFASQSGGLDVPNLTKKKIQAIDSTKFATRQYAKQQRTWIRGKLLRALEEYNALDRMVPLSATEVSLWRQNVEEHAATVVSAFLKGKPFPKRPTTSSLECDILVPTAKPEIKARYCGICDLTMMTQKEWDAHTRSKKHRRATRAPIDWASLYPKTQRPDFMSDAAAKFASG